MRRGIFILALLALAGLVGMSGWLGGTPSLGQPPKPFLIVVDAGHGGEDTGAIGLAGLIEKNLVLDIVRLIQIKALNEPKLKVWLTRQEDKYIAPKDRIALANEQKADLYISVHANYASDPFVRGIETLIHESASATSKAWAQVLQKKLIEETKAKSRGVKSAPLYLRDAQMPAALIEVGFVTNPEEANNLQQLTYQTAIAEAILAAVKEFLKIE